jgi:L-ornithine N5-oxygenase
VYEEMYDQLLDDPETAATTPRLKIFPHREVISADLVSSSSSDGGKNNNNEKVRLGLGHLLHCTVSEATYDVVILGTGYYRQSWRELVWNGLGDVFDFAGADMGLATPPEMVASESRASSSSTSSSVFETCSVQDAASAGGAQVAVGGPKLGAATAAADEVERNYRLRLPEMTSGGEKFRPTVWLQGCNETTHGISDSLLRCVLPTSSDGKCVLTGLTL